ncbi:MAG TPA: hypothetical protein VMV14_05720 [Acidimicrobiales bacterium]|nr:hypothetical protein [Acidimicrobiales bacterium]
MAAPPKPGAGAQEAPEFSDFRVSLLPDGGFAPEGPRRPDLWCSQGFCTKRVGPDYRRTIRLVEEIDVIDAKGAKSRYAVGEALAEVRQSISGVVWPPGADRFTIYPQSGKKSGEGNGVGPIKTAFITQLTDRGWSYEKPFPIPGVPGGSAFGPLDAAKGTDAGVVAVEWETGNISSSHRAMNKMCLGLRRGGLIAGVLIVPTRQLAQYLTDRIGNVYELLSYVDHWAAVPVDVGYLGIFAVEHDATSMDVPRILKATDGRALR